MISSSKLLPFLQSIIKRVSFSSNLTNEKTHNFSISILKEREKKKRKKTDEKLSISQLKTEILSKIFQNKTTLQFVESIYFNIYNERVKTGFSKESFILRFEILAMINLENDKHLDREILRKKNKFHTEKLKSWRWTKIALTVFIRQVVSHQMGESLSKSGHERCILNAIDLWRLRILSLHFSNAV